jgi:hypothetical protein
MNVTSLASQPLNWKKIALIAVVLLFSGCASLGKSRKRRSVDSD